MKAMIVPTGYSSPTGHEYKKCKRCKQEFYIVTASVYNKTICFCPYCGQEAVSKRHSKEDEVE